MPLRSYLQYRYFERDTIITRKAAIDAILGKARKFTSNLKMGYDSLLLATGIDLDSSTVELGANTGDEVLSAQLQAIEEPKDEIGFGEDKSKIITTYVAFTKEVKEKMSLKLSINTENGVTVETSKVVALLAQKPTLRQHEYGREY
ncbi:hypothetical protein K7432_012634 [Basidiobolus ranarum]|uniref:Uncharacterized protein n=1 Tax=Basidiobolus ranarum TaxID=34480 RepID=A0ABR2VS42_9FUNG